MTLTCGVCKGKLTISGAQDPPGLIYIVRGKEIPVAIWACEDCLRAIEALKKLGLVINALPQWEGDKATWLSAVCTDEEPKWVREGGEWLRENVDKLLAPGKGAGEVAYKLLQSLRESITGKKPQ